MTLDQMRDLFVEPATDNAARARMFALFDQWVHRLRQLNITATAWIDGSFVTRKPEPSDLDCVLWLPPGMPPVPEQGKIEALTLTDRGAASTMYGIDLYIELPTPDNRLHREAYWRGMLGFQHDRHSAKGFVELTI